MSDTSARPPARPGDQVTITACPDGPLLIRGPVELRAPDGTVVPRNRRTLALCRCGKSGLAPLCDGTHKAVGFRTPDRRNS